RLGDVVRADNAAGTASPVFDDKALPERLVQLLRDNASDAVDRAAGGIRRDDGDGSTWIGVGHHGCRGKPEQGHAQCGNEFKVSHEGSSQRLQLEGSWVASPVDQYILAGDEAGVCGTQECAIGAELSRPTVAPGRVGGRALLPDLTE